MRKITDVPPLAAEIASLTEEATPMTPSFKPIRACDRRLNLIDTGLEAATVLSLAAAIAMSQADLPSALYLLALPVATITLWACSGLVIDRQTLRGV